MSRIVDLTLPVASGMAGIHVAQSNDIVPGSDRSYITRALPAHPNAGNIQFFIG